MIKIEITINEREIKEKGNKVIKRVEVESVTKGMIYTNREMEVAKMLEKRMKPQEKVEVIDKRKNQKINKEKFEELLKELLNNL